MVVAATERGFIPTFLNRPRTAYRGSRDETSDTLRKLPGKFLVPHLVDKGSRDSLSIVAGATGWILG